MSKKLVDWSLPVYAYFSREPRIRCFMVGDTIAGHLVGIPSPTEENKGITVEVDEYGDSINSGKHIIGN